MSSQTSNICLLCSGARPFLILCIKDRLTNRIFCHLYSVIQKYNLYLLNSSKVCSGVFTRTRQCNGRQEISVLDYVFVTSDIYEQVRPMEIDEKNFFTPWTKLGKGRRFSDHHAIKLSLNLEFNKSPKRAKN